MRDVAAPSRCCRPGGVSAGAAAGDGTLNRALVAYQCGIADGGVSADPVELDPSKRFGARYGLTVVLSTMPSPVSVFVGFISPPEMLYRNSCMIVSKPCR